LFDVLLRTRRGDELLDPPLTSENISRPLTSSYDLQLIIKDSRAVCINYLPLVVKEALRLQRLTPLLIPRECWTPCRVLRFDVRVGVMVLVNTWAIGRDPRH
jgi:cytochrome P450